MSWTLFAQLVLLLFLAYIMYAAGVLFWYERQLKFEKDLMEQEDEYERKGRLGLT